MSTVTPVSHIAYGEEGERFYSKNAKGAERIIQMTAPMVLSSLGNIKFQKGNTPFVICDYGTADGGNSMQLIRKIIKSIKLKHGDSQPVLVVYEDLPMNDFKSLFATVQGPGSYLHEFREVYVTACGTSFHEQCLPAGTVHLGLSFTALQWLSRRPCNLSGALTHCANNNVAENEIFKKQAAKDWEGLLLNRAKELATGGELVLATGGRGRNGQYIGKGEHIKKAMDQIISELWKTMVTEEEFLNATVSCYYRTETEARAPFDDAESCVSKAGLRLLESKVLVAKCPFYEEWKASKKTQADAVLHAENLAASQRCWINSILMSSLSDQRSSEEKEMLVDAVWQRYKDMIVENPQDYSHDFVEIFLHIRKE